MMAMGTSTAGEIRHRVFQTQNTLLAPEINVVLYNDKARSRSFIVNFDGNDGKSPTANRPSCLQRKPVPFLNGQPFSNWDPAGSARPYAAFEQVASVAVIGAKSFAQRYYPVGFFSGMPCEVTLTLTDQSDGQTISRRIMVTKSGQAADYDPNNVSITSTVESLHQNHGRLVTILIKNSAAKPVVFRLAGKMLLRCDADISDSLVREGMEGGFVRIEEYSYAAVLTAVNMRPGPVSKECRLLTQFQAVAPLSRRHPFRLVTVPLTVKGQYRAASAHTGKDVAENEN